MDEPLIKTILLLGDPLCGKSRFLTRLSQGTQKAIDPTTPQDDQLFTFAIRIRNRAYSFNFYNLNTHSAESYTHVRPDAVIICYAIDDRRTLENAKQIWGKNVMRQYTQDRADGDVGVMLLGLKRDLRIEQEGVIYPQEVSRQDISSHTFPMSRGCGQTPLKARLACWILTCKHKKKGHRVAQEMRFDRYAECSAATGELIDRVCEDIAHMAVKNEKESGDSGPFAGACILM